MSYTQQLRRALCSGEARRPCCKRAILFGALAARGEYSGKNVSITVDADSVRPLVQDLVKNLYNVPSKTQRMPGRGIEMLSFVSSSAAKYLAEITTDRIPLADFRCDCCQSMFLRGIFLAAGRISSPNRSYHIELSLGERAEAFRIMLEETYGISFSITVRRSEKLLYLKRSESIEEALTMLGCNDMTFDLMNCKIECDLRSAANRVANCEAKNISRAISASMKQIHAIEKLLQQNKLSSLPPELEQTARLRLEHRDLSLAQLAELSVPPLTKSGISHRLQKLAEIAEEAL